VIERLIASRIRRMKNEFYEDEEIEGAS